jgi:PAS domain S-box-containing protein
MSGDARDLAAVELSDNGAPSGTHDTVAAADAPWTRGRMNWLNTTWLVIAAACTTLAAIHTQVWLSRRDAGANAAFAVLAASVAAAAYIELRLFQSTSLDEYGAWLRWYQVPIWSGLLSIVWFVRLYLRAGAAWLGWLAVGLRTVSLAANFASPVSVNFVELTSLEALPLAGVDVSIVRGVPNPWMAVAHLALLALLLFVFSATRDLWRRGERRRALTIGGSLVLFVTGGSVMGIGYFWGLWRFPTFLTPYFGPIVLAMGYELGRDLLRAAQLAQDLTAKDAALRGSERKLELAADAANAGLWSVERDTGQLWATSRALTMFGLEPDRAHLADDVLRAVHPDDREQVASFLHGAPRTDDRQAIEYRVVGADGELRWYATRGGVPPGEAGAGHPLMGATVDITDRKRAEEAAAHRQRELEHLSRVATLSELSGALAHELNQPLAIIMSNAEAAQQLLRRPEPDVAEVRAILDDIVDADARAGEVIQRLRGLLKRGAPQRRPLSINEVVRGVLNFMRGELVRRGVTVDAAFDESLGPIDADRVPVEQVLINLIGNACDAMATNAPNDQRLRIATEAEADAVRIRISDVGTGLPAQSERVFEPFFTTKPQGLGMGLAISHSIVAAHGGRLWAEPNPDRGATFILSLPAVKAAT